MAARSAASSALHRTVALRGVHVALAVDPDLDRRLRLHAAVLALLGDHPPGLQPEQRLVLARLAPDQQVEGAVGRLEVEAAVLERLDALDHARRGRVVELDARGLRALEDGALAAELGDRAPRGRCRPRPGRRARTSRDRRRPRRRACPPLCANAFAPTYGRFGVGHEVQQLVEEVRGLGEPGQVAAGTARPSSAAGSARWRRGSRCRSARRSRSSCPAPCPAPARTAATEFATPHSASLWQWMPTGVAERGDHLRRGVARPRAAATRRSCRTA